MILIRREGNKLNIYRGSTLVRVFDLAADEEVIMEAQQFTVRPIRDTADGEVRIVL